MDLLECAQCDRRYYLPGGATPASCTCPRCGSSLALLVCGISTIPLDARWLGPEVESETKPGVTVVDLRRRGKQSRRADRRILKRLADYFEVHANGGSVQVLVNGGRPADAALRVAAALDGVAADWEKRFLLPMVVSGGPPAMTPALPRAPGHIHLVDGTGNRAAGL